jgi:hypothetical protein
MCESTITGDLALQKLLLVTEDAVTHVKKED